MNVLLDAALDYAGRDWPVLPCGPRGKRPMTAHGLLDATIGPEIIRGWWARWPTANVGLRTGDVFDVLDIDGAEGFDELGQLSCGSPISGGPAVATGNGLHVFFHATGLGNRARFRPGAALTAGLPEAEARRTLGSGMKAGADHPRRVA